MRTASALVAVLLLSPAAAHAARISGTITGGVPPAALENIQVRLWGEGPKGFKILVTTFTSSAGTYSFEDVVVGSYKLDARMGPGMNGNWADRWWDRAPPTAQGYVQEDADPIVVETADDDIAGIDITLQSTGGFDGTVEIPVEGGQPVSGVQIRMEKVTDPRVHHNDVSQGEPHLGQYFIRGLEPGDYRLFAHASDGSRADWVADRTFPVVEGANGTLPEIVLGNVVEDPREPDGDSGVRDTDVSDLLGTVPRDVVLHGIVFPTSDRDFTCFEAVQGQRLILSARGTFLVRESPWMDPVLRVTSGDGTATLFEDDDGGPGVFDSRIDTGIVERTARICAVVSSYGEQSGGAYELTLSMGNRAPSMVVTQAGLALVEPARVKVTEDVELELTATYSDPEGGESITVTHVDSQGDPVEEGLVTHHGRTAVFTWRPDETAARLSPYTVRFAVTDGEFERALDVLVEVAAENQPPSTPALLSPDAGARVNTSTPGITVQNATDPDGDSLRYEFQLTYGDDPDPAQDVMIPGHGSGQTTFTPEPLPENTRVRWRARAFDGTVTNGYSAWSDARTFLVDVANDPPSAPVFHKPAEGEEVLVLRPTLSAVNPVDPEADPVTLTFQVARDPSCSDLVVTSEEVAMDVTASTTTWRVTQDLEWSHAYYARVHAADDRGGESEFCDPVSFSLKEDALPQGLQFGAPFTGKCSGFVLGAEVPDQIEVRGAVDPDGEPISVQLEIVDDRSGDTLFQQTVPQGSGDLVVFDVSSVSFEEDVRYRVRARAGAGEAWSDWIGCDLTVNAEKGGGCGCGAAGGGALLAFAALLALRRRSR